MTDMHELELRVLEGLHQGARAPLKPDSITHPVGKTTDFDIVLRDLPIDSGEIRITEQAWTWRDQDFEITVPWGEAVSVSGVVIQVCERSDPWPENPGDPVRHQRQVSQKASSEPEEETSESTEVGAVDEELTREGSETPAQPRHRTAAPSRTPSLGIGIAAMAALLIVVVSAWIAISPPDPEVGSAAAEQVPVESAKTQAINEEELKAITALIDEKGLSERVEATPNSSTGRIDIRGVMADDEEFEEFVRTVRKVTSRVLLRIVSHRDFATDVSGLQQDLPEGVQISTRPIGVIVLKGMINNDQDREALIERIENLVPMAAEIDVQLKTKSELAKEARDNQRAGRDAATALPKIMAVVSGPEPFLVLQSGDRVMVGGVISGHMLTAITGSHIEYKNPEGKTIRVPR